MPSGAFPSSILFQTLPAAFKALYIHHFQSEKRGTKKKCEKDRKERGRKREHKKTYESIECFISTIIFLGDSHCTTLEEDKIQVQEEIVLSIKNSLEVIEGSFTHLILIFSFFVEFDLLLLLFNHVSRLSLFCM